MALRWTLGALAIVVAVGVAALAEGGAVLEGCCHPRLVRPRAGPGHDRLAARDRHV